MTDDLSAYNFTETYNVLYDANESQVAYLTWMTREEAERELAEIRPEFPHAALIRQRTIIITEAWEIVPGTTIDEDAEMTIASLFAERGEDPLGE